MVSFGGQAAGTGSSSPSVTAVTFGEQEIGTTTPAQTVLLTNNGTGELRIKSITVSGPNSEDFAETNDCGSMLPAGKSCELRIRFSPRERGERTAVIRIEDSGEARSLEVQARGIGAGPEAKPLRPQCTSQKATD